MSHRSHRRPSTTTTITTVVVTTTIEQHRRYYHHHHHRYPLRLHSRRYYYTHPRATLIVAPRIRFLSCRRARVSPIPARESERRKERRGGYTREFHGRDPIAIGERKEGSREESEEAQ